MVHSLFCAEPEFDDDIVISYADILYGKDIAAKIASSPADVSVVVDRDWRKLWEARMEDPLGDAETMKLDGGGNILELGKPALERRGSRVGDPGIDVPRSSAGKDVRDSLRGFVGV